MELMFQSDSGSFDTQEYSIEFGKNYYGIDIAGFVNFYNTNGLSDTIEADALSSVPFFKRFSLAPGDTDDSRNNIDLDLKISYKDLEFNAKYLNKDTEPFVGPLYILTNQSDQHFNYLFCDLSYKWKIWEQLTVKTKLYYDQYDTEFFDEALPDGFIIPFDLDNDGDIERFPNGMIGDAIYTNRRLGSDIQLDYKISDNNTFTLGFSYEWERLDNVEFITNFDPLSLASLGSMQNDVRCKIY